MTASVGSRQALEVGCFHQVPLLSSSELAKAAVERGLVDSSMSMSWETLDREDILPPVAYVRADSHAPVEMHLRLLMP